MGDDDLDLDLDLTVEDEKKPAKAAKPAEPAKEKKAVKATAARRPSRLTGVVTSVTAPFANLRLPRWDVRNFVYVLLGLIVLGLLVENWAPVRVNLFGLCFELPKAIGFVLDLALGALIMWLWLRPRLSRERTEPVT